MESNNIGPDGPLEPEIGAETEYETGEICRYRLTIAPNEVESRCLEGGHGHCGRPPPYETMRAHVGEA